MKTVIEEKLQEHGDKCRIYRVVKGKDVVTSVPPKIFGFCHLVDPIRITDEGLIVGNTKEQEGDDDVDDTKADLLELTRYRAMTTSSDAADSSSSSVVDPTTKYDRLVSRVPRALRDHMPDFYLKPVLRTLGLQYGSTRAIIPANDSSPMNPVVDTDKKSHKSGGKSQPPKRTWIPRAFRSKRKTAPTVVHATGAESERTMYM
jgi:hypothetical protein